MASCSIVLGGKSAEKTDEVRALPDSKLTEGSIWGRCCVVIRSSPKLWIFAHETICRILITYTDLGLSTNISFIHTSQPLPLNGSSIKFVARCHLWRHLSGCSREQNANFPLVLRRYYELTSSSRRLCSRCLKRLQRVKSIQSNYLSRSQ